MGKGIGISISISKAWEAFRHHWQQRNHEEIDSIVREGLTSNLRGLAMHHNFDTKFSCIYYIMQLAHHDVQFHAIVRIRAALFSSFILIEISYEACLLDGLGSEVYVDL